jgi:hypothetical protein
MEVGKNVRIGLLMGTLALAACAGENHNEQLADRVTMAIVANDMRPVEPDFNALARPGLENRAKVGRLSDDLNALGKFKRTHETTPKDAPPLRHTFDADFEKGAWVEDLTFDSDGKIASFHVHPPAATTQ